MIGFDLDGVLAEAPPKPPRPWRYLSGWERREHQRLTLKHYESAKPLLSPLKGKRTIIISARKKTREIEDATWLWLGRTYQRTWFDVHLLEGPRTYETVVEFKAKVIRRIGVTDFIEDNPTVVRELRKKLKRRARVWLYRDGQLIL